MQLQRATGTPSQYLPLLQAFSGLRRTGWIALLALVLVPGAALANRTVKGRITDADGKPLAGFKIRAWDSDPGATDDLMGEDRTDSDGRYSIRYRDGHWDPFPHRITKWRPDIYITVLLPYGSEWVNVHRSSTHDDWKLSDDLTVNVKLTERDRWSSGKTKFDPVIHGFPFPNDRFTVCAAPTCKEENWAGQYLNDIAQFRWALCGGMSLTALQRFERGVPVESFNATLKEELVKNQLKTLTATNWAKFIEWDAKPKLPHTFSPHTIGQATKEEWPKLFPLLDAGKPAVLGLIRVQSSNPSDVGGDHQVLAIGYRYNELTRAVEVDVYDPNYPKITSTLYFNLRIPNNQIHAVQRTPGRSNDALRGFFIVTH